MAALGSLLGCLQHIPYAFVIGGKACLDGDRRARHSIDHPKLWKRGLGRSRWRGPTYGSIRRKAERPAGFPAVGYPWCKVSQRVSLRPGLEIGFMSHIMISHAYLGEVLCLHLFSSVTPGLQPPIRSRPVSFGNSCAPLRSGPTQGDLDPRCGAAAGDLSVARHPIRTVYELYSF